MCELNHSSCLIKMDFRGGQRKGGPVLRLCTDPGQNDSDLGHIGNRGGSKKWTDIGYNLKVQ